MAHKLTHNPNLKVKPIFSEIAPCHEEMVPAFDMRALAKAEPARILQQLKTRPRYWFDLRDHEGKHILHYLARYSRGKTLRKVLENFEEARELVNVFDKNDVSPILEAVQEARIENIEALIEHGAYLNKPDKEGYSVGYRAVINCSRPCFERLVKAAGEHINWNIMPHKKEETAADRAAINREYYKLDIILSQGGQFTWKGREALKYYLYEALKKGDKELSHRIIKYGPAVDHKLINAALGDFLTLSYLLDRVEYIEFTHLLSVVARAPWKLVRKALDKTKGELVLHDLLIMAAINPDSRVMKYFLEKTEDPSLLERPREGYRHYVMSPLLAAVSAGNTRALRFMLCYSISQQALNQALELAIYGSTEVIKLLLKKGAQPPSYALAVLDYEKASPSLIRQLAQRGADVNAVYEDEGLIMGPPLAEAAANANKQAFKTLVSLGASHSLEVLFGAIDSNDPQFLSWLLENYPVYQSFITQPDKEGYTPLEWAEENNPKMAEYLKRYQAHTKA